MIYLQLFWTFFQVGLFSFGGGYASLPLIQHHVVENNGWLTETEFIDIITISQMTPGPIAINASTFVGTKVAGLAGSVIATAGCVTPSFLIVLLLARLYYKYRNLSAVQGIISGLRPAVVALITAAGMGIFRTAMRQTESFPFSLANINWTAFGIFAVSFLLLWKTRLGPIQVMLLSGLAGVVINSIF
jgi:Chromate transporter.